MAIKLSATVFALLGLGLSFLLARYLRFGGWVLRLVLSGIVISALLSAGLGVMKYLADPLTELQEITFWLLGGPVECELEGCTLCTACGARWAVDRPP